MTAAPRLVAIVGPTATGKSALGVALARRLNGEIVACDSTAVYQRIDIGTDKVPLQEQQGVPHHMVDVVPPDVAYSAARYALDAAAEQYEQATLQAFAEASNALVARQKLDYVFAERVDTVKALQTSVALSLQRYNDGIANYFEVLEAEQQLFPAELDLARTQRDMLVAVVTLYRVLGGGWSLQ